MSVHVGQANQLRAPLLHHPLMPHWLTHLGALGVFSVAVVDSSVIPLPLPGSTDLLLLWLVANRGDPWIHHLAGWQKRWRSGAASLCASAAAAADRRLGRASSSFDCLSARLASAAHSSVAVCACFRCVRRHAQPLPCCIRNGSRHSLLFHSVARRCLWPPCCPDVCGNAPEMVGATALGLRVTVR